MKKIIFIVAFIAMTTGAFFFYNSSTIANDKNGKCCSGQCSMTDNCQKECKSECSVNSNKTSSGAKDECPYMSGKCSTKTEAGACPYKSSSNYKKENTNKSGSCPYIKKEAEVKI